MKQQLRCRRYRYNAGDNKVQKFVEKSLETAQAVPTMGVLVGKTLALERLV